MREFTLFNLRITLYVPWTTICSRSQEEHLKLKITVQPYATLQTISVPLLIYHVYIVKANCFEVIQTFNIIKVKSKEKDY